MNTTKMVELLWQGTFKDLVRWRILQISEAGDEKNGWLQGFKVIADDIEVRFLMRAPSGVEITKTGCHRMAFALEVASPQGVNTVTTDPRVIGGQAEPKSDLLLFTFLVIRRRWMYQNDPIRFSLQYTNLGEFSRFVPAGWDISAMRANLYD